MYSFIKHLIITIISVAYTHLDVYKRQIIYGATSPIICTECENKLKSHTIPSDFMFTLNKELKKIRKSRYYVITDFINGHPYFSLIIAAISGILVSMVANGLYDWIKYMLIAGMN